MKKFYSINIPTWIDGISTTIDVGSGCIVHTAFDNGLSRDRMYNVLSTSNLDNVVLQVITDDMSECADRIGEQFKSNLGIYEVRDVESGISVIRDMISRLQKRYQALKDSGCKNIEVYNSLASKENQMKPVIICWIGVDWFLRQMSYEDSMNLFSEIFKLGRAVGVTLMLHSYDFYGIQEAVSKDFYYNFASIDVSTANENPKEIGIAVYNEIYNMNIRPKHIM